MTTTEGWSFKQRPAISTPLPVLCSFLEIQTLSINDTTQIFETVQLEWKDDIEYQIDCGNIRARESNRCLTDTVPSQTYRASILLPTHRIAGVAHSDPTMVAVSSAKTPILLAYRLTFLA